MSSAKQQSVNTELWQDKGVHLIQLCSVQSAVNESCKAFNGITYTSGSPENERQLTPFQDFLCKLAQICDTVKGGDTITALVALKTANGPEYLFGSNNRSDMELKDTQKFLHGFLEYVGRNPEELDKKAMQKQILWRALEFNFPKVKFYLKRTLALLGECINLHVQLEGSSLSEIVLRLRRLEAQATIPCDIQASQNAKSKFLRDSETFIKAIQATSEDGFSKTIEELTHDDRPRVPEAWSELRHYFGRLHSYRQAADCIFEASQVWPELFTGFTVNYVHSARPLKISLPRPMLRPEQVIEAAFPDMEMDEYRPHLELLRRFGLDKNIQERLRQKSIKRGVHCEVLLHSFLVRKRWADASEYWNNSMFIATSKQPCRLCHYYFADADNDFQVQSSHMNVYPKWRLPDICEGQDEEVVEHQEELLDDIIEQMQDDILRIVRNKVPQGKTHDSRTGPKSMVSGYTALEHQHMPQRNSGPFAGPSGYLGRANSSDVLSETSSFDGLEDDDSWSPGAAV